MKSRLEPARSPAAAASPCSGGCAPAAPRSHHSASSRAGREAPRITTPSASSAASASSMSAAGSCERRARSRRRDRVPDLRAGRARSRPARPRATRSRAAIFRRRGDRGRDNARPGTQLRNCGSRSAAIQSVVSGPQREPRRAPRRRRAHRQVTPQPARARLFRRDEPEPEQRIVQLVGVARLGPRLLAHARDRRGVEPAEIGGGLPASSQRRPITACVRRSSSGASSRKA